MKTTAYLVLLLSLNAFSQAPVAEGNFAQKKAEKLARIEKGLSMMNEMKACVSASANQESMVNCHSKMKTERKQMRAERKEKRKATK